MIKEEIFLIFNENKAMVYFGKQKLNWVKF